MNTFLLDVNYGLRMLRKSPGFTLIAILALGLGIGANTAIFSVLNALLLRQLPYKDPERVVLVWEYNKNRPRKKQNVVSPANFIDWKRQNGVFENIAAFMPNRMNLTGSGEPEEIPIQYITGDFFSVLGALPLAGRVANVADDKPGAPRVVVLSYGLWQRRFGRDPSIVGRSILMNSRPAEVIGIMPQGFHFLNKETEAWMPLALDFANHRQQTGRWMTTVARLKPGVSREQAQANMDALGLRLEQEYPRANKSWAVNVLPLREQLVGELRLALYVLFGAVGCVLLIACGNVANLLLARAASRQREIAIRASLGAGRGRVARQLLTESIILALLGGLVGVLLAQWGVAALVALSPKDLPLSKDISLDLTVLAFTVVLSMLTGLIFGFAPALAAARTDLTSSLKEGARSTAGGSHWLRQGLIVAEVALTLLLLTGAGLLIRSFLRLQSVSPGVNVENLLTMRVLLQGADYQDSAKRTAFFTEAIARTAAVPGVRAVSAVNFLPFTGLAAGTGFRIAGRPDPTPGDMSQTTVVRTVMPEYFSTMGIPRLHGRDFDALDNSPQAPLRFIVNQAFATKHFAKDGPIGQRISVAMQRENPFGEIIGVVGDLPEGTLDSDPQPTVYYPHGKFGYNFMTFVVRSEGDPIRIAGPAAAAIRTLKGDQPVADVRTMKDWIGETLARNRFNMMLLAIFAALALTLAAVGLYGVLAYAVAERTRELGLRMALGARPANVLTLVMRQGIGLTLAGIVIGLGAALVVTRVLATLLFQVKPLDPVTFSGVAALMLVIASAAVYVPARRATKIDPLVALRYE